MDALERILAIEEIKRLKARYFRCLDTKDWEGWLGVFTEDVTLEFDRAISTLGRDGDPAPKMVGKAALAQFVPHDLATASTVHHGHTPEIELTGDADARGIWAMEDIVDHGHTVIHGWGHYHETYRKVDGAWRIASVKLTRIRYRQEWRDRIALG